MAGTFLSRHLAEAAWVRAWHTLHAGMNRATPGPHTLQDRFFVHIRVLF
jgi:hypothetical protein